MKKEELPLLFPDGKFFTCPSMRSFCKNTVYVCSVPSDSGNDRSY